MRVLKIFAGVVGALVAGLAITFVAARFNDGPLRSHLLRRGSTTGPSA